MLDGTARSNNIMLESFLPSESELYRYKTDPNLSLPLYLSVKALVRRPDSSDCQKITINTSVSIIIAYKFITV